MEKLKAKLNRASQFLHDDIWRDGQVGGIREFWHKVLRVMMIVVSEFKRDQVGLKASATTYLSILSIVPLVAIVFAISKGFGLEELIEEELDKLFLGQEMVKDSIFQYAQNMLNNAQGGVIVGVSVVFLFFTVMRLLNHLEEVFNEIWGKQRGRNLVRKFTDYLALLIIAPILIVLSSGVTIYIENKIRAFGKGTEIEDLLSPVVAFFMQLSPFVLIWVLFTLIFIIMPNVRVSFKSGLIAGVITGTLFQFLQWAFINFSFLMGNYGAVYGGLAVLPLFFIFTQLSWTIVFVGGELSYAVQMVDEFIPEEKNIRFSYSERKKIALSVMQAIVKAFEQGEAPYSKMSLSKYLGIPHRFVSNAVNRLVTCKVLTKSVAVPGAPHVYLPSMDINKLSIEYIYTRLDETGVGGLYDQSNAVVGSIHEVMKSLKEEMKKSPNNKLLKDL
ncbi:YihY/virulence factor BrkB family protein [Reichenbachiella agarivorans]|uniref:YihY/virulence factor BrkB family protein n=1 Tax=Reichenbachiella agarivorans TaxID=2979464 RepID=A0ABY6CJW2_9BACT|nr:YihY/virulence factor BrkB family protein [Reichenbachiella agarivorans]UXP30806.1 YihY/virulence factor BrkB family protein [Reichenbachiella agarivorans]